jgi:hypothetical protein
LKSQRHFLLCFSRVKRKKTLLKTFFALDPPIWIGGTSFYPNKNDGTLSFCQARKKTKIKKKHLMVTVTAAKLKIKKVNHSVLWSEETIEHFHLKKFYNGCNLVVKSKIYILCNLTKLCRTKLNLSKIRSQSDDF